MKVKFFILSIAAGLLIFAGNTFACDTCGCQDTKVQAEACACGMNPADCTMCSAKAGGMDCADCPDKGNCTACKSMAAAACPAGGDAALMSDSGTSCACGMSFYDCAACLGKATAETEAHLGRMHAVPESIDVLSRSMAAFNVGYMTSNMSNIESTFQELIGHAAEQNLLGDTTRVYGVYHGDLYGEFNDGTEYQAAFSVPAGHNPAAPVEMQTIPGGEYLVVVHRGAYEDLPDTYQTFLSWAKDAGIPFDSRPTFEHYYSDPATTPVEDLITEIYFPVANPHTTMHSHGDDHTHGA